MAVRFEAGDIVAARAFHLLR